MEIEFNKQTNAYSILGNLDCGVVFNANNLINQADSLYMTIRSGNNAPGGKDYRLVLELLTSCVIQLRRDTHCYVRQAKLTID